MVHKLILLFPFLWATVLSVSPVLATQNIHYEASYKGILSLFRTLPIAEVDLSIEPNHFSKVDELTLSVSSEKYPLVEKLYAFRYWYSSLYQSDLQQTLFFEHIKKTKKLKHRVGLFDLEKKEIQLFSSEMPDLLKVDQKVTIADAKSLNLTVKSQKLSHLPESLIDRLSLIQAIRNQLLEHQSSGFFNVTNGDELMKYQFSITAHEHMNVDGQKVKVAKVKVEAFPGQESDKSMGVMEDEAFLMGKMNEPEYIHPPIYIWFTLDQFFTPVKFVNHHSLGKFVIQMVSKSSLSP